MSTSSQQPRNETPLTGKEPSTESTLDQRRDLSQYRRLGVNDDAVRLNINLRGLRALYRAVKGIRPGDPAPYWPAINFFMWEEMDGTIRVDYQVKNPDNGNLERHSLGSWPPKDPHLEALHAFYRRSMQAGAIDEYEEAKQLERYWASQLEPENQKSTPGSSPSTAGTTSTSTPGFKELSSSLMSNVSSDLGSGLRRSYVYLAEITGFY